MRNLLWCLAPLALVFGCDKEAETDTESEIGTEICSDVVLINGDGDALSAASGIRYCETDTEIDSEKGGGLIRDMAVTCPEVVGPAACPEDQLDDCDCAEGEVCGQNIEGFTHCDCYAPCATDADCGADEVCFCASRRAEGHSINPINTCLPSACDGPEDCGGEVCGVALDQCRVAMSQRCHTAADDCADDGDCNHGSEQCTYDEAEARWTCQEEASCE